MNFNSIPFILAAFFLLMLILRISMFVNKGQSARQQDERLRALEQKVEMIARHLNVSSSAPIAPPLPSPFENSASTSWNQPSGSALDASDRAQIVSLLRGNQKIEAIRFLRERTNLDLKASKEAVEAIERTM